jgi:CRP-like cAMP-binding protein
LSGTGFEVVRGSIGVMGSPGLIFKSSKDSVAFSAGDVIFSTGDSGDVMYAVQEGEVDLRVGDAVVETVGEGGILGEMAIIDKGPRSATAVARTDCKLVPIDERRFEFLTQQTPNFALSVLRVMVRRLRASNAQV